MEKSRFIDMTPSEIAVDILKRNARHEVRQIPDEDKRQKVARCVEVLAARKVYCAAFGKRLWV